MKLRKWLKLNTVTLVSKTVAVTGSTGGLGKELCKYLAKLGANLILIDRNFEKSFAFADELSKKYGISVKCITADLADFASVKIVAEKLKQVEINIFIHNAGAYSIPRYLCDTGFDNIFQINFVSPYFIIKEILPQLRKVNGRVAVVGSIAHNYSKSDENDIDFSSREAASKVYGNAKRYLMFSLYELFKNETEATLAVTHPGITFTNITAHYPKLIFAVIKHPMKVIFMKPEKAVLSVLKGCFENTEYHYWIGPRFFDVWGMPKKKKLTTCSSEESKKIGKAAEEIYTKLLTEKSKN